VPRVLRIINRLNLGGPTFNVALLTKYLPAEYETLLVAGAKQRSEESSDFIVRELGLNYVLLQGMKRSINPFQDLFTYFKLRKIIRDFKPDIVHTHAAKAGTLGRLAALHEKVPVIVHTFHGHVFHSYFKKWKTRIFISIERYLARKTSGIIAISEKQKLELSRTYKITSADRIKVIPLGFDLSRFQEDIPEKRKSFREKYFLEEDEIAIGIIGRLVPVKNHSLFLHSAARAIQLSGKKLRFFIIGDGEERKSLLSQCEHLKLDHVYFQKEPRKSGITFCGWIRAVDKAIAGLDIITLTSFNEGTPVSLIEAQAGNKPIVSTRVGGIENIVVPGKTALLVESFTEEDFTSSLLKLTEDDNFRKEISSAGWELVKERFHYTRLVKEMADYYQNLSAKSKNSRTSR
jgi:glycosyltransferase involved in cell wall biosynthesis